MSVDPITKGYPELTPYQLASNRPIDGIDLDGKEWAAAVNIRVNNATIEVQTSFTVRVKVVDKSEIVKAPNIIKKKAEVFKSSIESKFKSESTFILFGMPFTMKYNTEVILDYSAPTQNDGQFGYLHFDDRESVSTTSTFTVGSTTTTETIKTSVPGETKGG